ncbi:gas vesicle protein [Streptomyces durbertensis]|uniref:Gas vesicle protein n=1 Tax=Streptomyces durbertensis TaxID=2448886 RepID=A0ABR6EJY4_9ACTN|nr:gas vesicle protein [Streptomyces durbertensis]MBB1245630.1 gas vesicle protein [Streptomyces durbertensis]
MPGPQRSAAPAYGQPGSSANLADILERVLDKGVVIAGDIQINLLDIELLTIRLRLLVASVDKAKEMGIDWWEHDPSLSSRARPAQRPSAPDTRRDTLAEENERLRAEIARLRSSDGPAEAPPAMGETPSDAASDTTAEGTPKDREETR